VAAKMLAASKASPEAADAVQTAITEDNGSSESALKGSYKLLGIFPVKDATTILTKRSYVILGGDVFGIKLYTKGVLIAKTDTVTTEKGSENPAFAAGLRSGDIIEAIDGKEVNRKQEVSDAILGCEGEPLDLTVRRAGDVLHLSLEPVLGAGSDKYLAGLWIRDSSAGIGTVTFYDPESNTLAGLGHAICDVDTGEILPVSGGELVRAKVMGCYKGVSGKPGELCGVFENEVLAKLKINSAQGIYGTLNALPEGKKVPVALQNEVKTGPAQIYATVDGDAPRYYDAEIEKVSAGSASSAKNMTIRITDETLKEKTGGIVQGMSGAPLLQNGVLVGAVTHVFVNTPLAGYAIFAQTMVEVARGELQEAAA
jgi:stage IV sporulation protein B